jgi:hypothetical protein
MTMFRPSAIIGTLPNTLVNGTLADAVPVMADLNFIVTQVNANAAPLANTALLNVTNSFTLPQAGVSAQAVSQFVIAQDVQNNSYLALTSTFGTNTLTARTALVIPSSLVAGQSVFLIPSQTNTGAASLSRDSLGSFAILQMGSALAGGELKAAVPVELLFDGSFYNVIGPPPKTATGTFGNVVVGTNPAMTGIIRVPNNVSINARNAGNSGDVNLVYLDGSNFVQVGGGVQVVANLSPITNSLGGDVNLNNTGTYFNGPAVAQGTSGTWFVSGSVTCLSGASPNTFTAKLWDGTTVIASGAATTFAGATVTVIALSGFMTSPAGNLRIDVKDITATDGKIVFNSSGNSKDSTITAFRIG